MNDELRNAIGKASYEAALGDDVMIPWDKLSEAAKEVNMRSAEAAVVCHNEWMREYLKRELGIKGERGDV
jgi:hypothetical protein